MKTAISSLVIILLLTNCAKKECREGNLLSNQINLYFVLPVKVYPAKDTFKIGDTLWIEQEFSDQLANINSGKTYKLANFDFTMGMSIDDLNKPDFATYPNPKIVAFMGRIGGENGNDFIHEYQNNIYRFKAAFIIERKGFYKIGFGGSPREGKGSVSGITTCKNEYYDFDYTVNNKGDNNYEMLQFSVANTFKNYSLDRFNKEGSYCFIVK